MQRPLAVPPPLGGEYGRGLLLCERKETDVRNRFLYELTIFQGNHPK